MGKTDRQTDRDAERMGIDRQTDRDAERLGIDRQTDRDAERMGKTDRQTET